MIAAGHAAKDVWSYTPRQIKAFLFLARRRKRLENAESLTYQALAARGKTEDLQKKIKDLSRE